MYSLEKLHCITVVMCGSELGGLAYIGSFIYETVKKLA
jgi:hypothetical protein